jgi:hypothetical protein
VGKLATSPRNGHRVRRSRDALSSSLVISLMAVPSLHALLSMSICYNFIIFNTVLQLFNYFCMCFLTRKLKPTMTLSSDIEDLGCCDN